MNATQTSIGDLFQRDVRFMAPLYQRPYVWTRLRNLAPLWEALERLSRQELARGKASQKPRPYFIGAIVIERLDRPASRVPSWQLIDGQQRLTTLQVALSEWSRVAAAHGEAKIAELFAGLTRNQLVSKEDPNEVFKVWPTNHDQISFKATMLSEPVAADATQNPLIVDTAKYFRTNAERWLETSGRSASESLEALLIVAKQRLELVEISLDRDDDAQQIFETLNALGTPLLPGDLVKNYLLRAVPEDEAALLYEKYWRRFEDNAGYWRLQVRPGRQRTTRLDLFLQNYLAATTMREVQTTDLFGEFKKSFEDSHRTPAEELATLVDYAQVFERIDSIPKTEPESALGLVLGRLRGMETTTIYPLLLRAMKDLEGGALVAFLSVLESFLVRRMVCRLSTRGYNQIFVQALEAVGANLSAGTISKWLLSGSDEETSRWPSNGEFNESWLTTEMYRTLRSQRLRVLFDGLERVARSSKVEPIVYVGDLTIEHLLPQSWTEDMWPLPGDMTPDEAARRRKHLLQTVGNLTTVTQRLNTEESNAAWSVKRALLLKHSVSVLNNALPDRWDDGSIEPRARQLFEYAKAAWPRPTAGDDEAWRKQPKGAPDDEEDPESRGSIYREFLTAVMAEFRASHPEITAAAGGGGSNYLGFPSGYPGARFMWSFAAKERFRIEVYLDLGGKDANKKWFDDLLAQRPTLEGAFGGPLSWERLDTGRGSRIAFYREGNVYDNPELYHELRDWAVDTMARFAAVVRPRLA